MDELGIAMSMADTLNLDNNYANVDEYLEKLGRLEILSKKLAMSKANAKKQDFETVLMDVYYNCSIYLGKLLEDTIDPVLKGLTEVVVSGGGGGVTHACGVCQEDIEMGEEGFAMGCKHVFHKFCIWKWLKHKNQCPLCRFTM